MPIKFLHTDIGAQSLCSTFIELCVSIVLQVDMIEMPDENLVLAIKAELTKNDSEFDKLFSSSKSVSIETLKKYFSDRLKQIGLESRQLVMVEIDSVGHRIGKKRI